MSGLALLRQPKDSFIDFMNWYPRARLWRVIHRGFIRHINVPHPSGVTQALRANLHSCRFVRHGLLVSRNLRSKESTPRARLWRVIHRGFIRHINVPHPSGVAQALRANLYSCRFVRHGLLIWISMRIMESTPRARLWRVIQRGFPE